jgi:hypothetical protein
VSSLETHVESLQKELAKVKEEHNTFGRTIIAEEDMSGIYKGAGPRLLQSVLTAAILSASQRRIYELTKVTPLFLCCAREDEVTCFICIALAL